MGNNADQIPTTIDMLNEVKSLIKKEKGISEEVSDYALAKRLGFSHQRIYRLMAGTHTLDEKGCETVADALGWPLETVLACVYLERSRRSENDKLTQAWEHICQRVAPSLAPAITGLILGIETARVILSL